MAKGRKNISTRPRLDQSPALNVERLAEVGGIETALVPPGPAPTGGGSGLASPTPPVGALPLSPNALSASPTPQPQRAVDLLSPGQAQMVQLVMQDPVMLQAIAELASASQAPAPSPTPQDVSQLLFGGPSR